MLQKEEQEIEHLKNLIDAREAENFKKKYLKLCEKMNKKHISAANVNITGITAGVLH